MSRNYPRVLIISFNAFSDTQNTGKILSVFFSKWDKTKLAQIYLNTDVPDFSVCNKFFQLNDFDILKRAFFCKKVQGKLVGCSDVSEMKILKKRITHNSILKIVRRNISPLFCLLRDLVWDIAGFKTREMKKFIDDFNPQIVFFQSSNGVFSFSLAKWVCKYKNIPLVMQTSDDYVSGMFTFDPFSWVQHMRIKQAYKWAVSYSDCIVAIGDKMAKEYKLRFGGNYIVAMNSISDLNLPNYTPVNKIINFVYAGNLGLNRWNVLVLIADCLKELQNEEELNGQLSIYSLAEPGTKELSLLNNLPFSSFKGALNTEELNSVKTHSDVLVYVEAFDRRNRHITRLSISTKIPEYLASGRCILAVGPEDVASMQYLTEYDLAVTVMSDKKSDIKEALKEIMLNSKLRTRYAEKGVGIAQLRHNADKTAESIFQIITSAINNDTSLTR